MPRKQIRPDDIKCPICEVSGGMGCRLSLSSDVLTTRDGTYHRARVINAQQQTRDFIMEGIARRRITRDKLKPPQ